MRTACRIWAIPLALSLAAAVPNAYCASIRVLVQKSALAGSQYYALARLRENMRVGDILTLEREPLNPHDAMAIAVYWRGNKLGYLPRKENRVVALAMDRGERVVGRIHRLRADPDPWRALEVEVFVEL